MKRRTRHPNQTPPGQDSGIRLGVRDLPQHKLRDTMNFKAKERQYENQTLDRYLDRLDRDDYEDPEVEYFEPDYEEMLEARREGRGRYY